MKVTDGYPHISQYIPKDLLGMFYRNPIPDYKYRTADGYEPYGFSTKGLVLYLPLFALKGAENGTTFKSVDAYRHTATVTGALWQPNGRSFDGDDRINCGAGFRTLTDVSVEMWLRATDLTGSVRPFMYYLSTSDAWGAHWSATGDLAVYDDIDDAGATLYATAAALNTWHHAVFILDSLDNKFYLNGVLAGSGTAASDDWSSLAGDLIIGARTGAGALGLIGHVGEARVYNRVLSLAEVAHNRLCTIWRYQ